MCRSQERRPADGDSRIGLAEKPLDSDAVPILYTPYTRTRRGEVCSFGTALISRIDVRFVSAAPRTYRRGGACPLRLVETANRVEQVARVDVGVDLDDPVGGREGRRVRVGPVVLAPAGVDAGTVEVAGECADAR